MKMCDDDDLERSEVLLAAIGNPNIDITVKLNEDSLFKKYNLEFDRTTPVDKNTLKGIEQDFKKMNPDIVRTPGGCAQNTLRIFQWLVGSKFRSNMIGSVGVDEGTIFLENELKKSGVLTSYSSKKDYPTAFVFIFIYNHHMAAVYSCNAVASGYYSLTDLLADNRALGSLKNSKIVLFEGFFVIHSDKVGREAIKICAKHNTLTSFNVCGEYLPNVYPDIIIPYVKSCHIVICNQPEFIAVCKVLKIATDDFTKSLISVFGVMMEENVFEYKIKSMEQHKKILIVTCGSKPVYCVSGNNNVVICEVPVVPEDKIKDVTGAGDSFLAGFLYGILNDFTILKCLELGNKVAAEILQQHGCVVPEKSSSTFLRS